MWWWINSILSDMFFFTITGDKFIELWWTHSLVTLLSGQSCFIHQSLLTGKSHYYSILSQIFSWNYYNLFFTISYLWLSIFDFGYHHKYLKVDSTNEHIFFIMLQGFISLKHILLLFFYTLYNFTLINNKSVHAEMSGLFYLSMNSY